MKQLFNDKSNCCGCGACVNICPKNAISFKADDYGFLFPEIEETLCIDCGLCQKVCYFQNNEEISSPLKVFAAARRDETKIMSSSSGGIFAVLAESIISDGGVVFGCSMEYKEGTLSAEHILIDTSNELLKLQGSKYVQSNIGCTYKQVKDYLEKGKKVLYSGTPCQIAGLNGYLRKKYDKLLTIDIICHGVPSLDFFRGYIHNIERRENITITDYKFRDKKNGWGLHAVIFFKDKNGNNNIKSFPYYKSSYFNMFIDSHIYRDSCYKCKYACKNRPADITLGDYWGITLVHPELKTKDGKIFDLNKGVSVILANTETGMREIENISLKCHMIESDFERASKYNNQLREPSTKGTLRDSIMQCYKQGGYNKVEKYYSPFLRKKKIKKFIKKFVPKKIISILKK